MSDAPVIDPQSIQNLRDLNPGDNDEFLREIVGIYLEDTPNRLAELDRSLASGDTPTFIRAAHSVKGSSANIGAMVVRSVAEKLEHLSSREGLANVGALLSELKTEFARAQSELAKLIAVS